MRVLEMDDVAHATIYTPDKDHAEELRADGIEPRSTLEVVVWGSHPNPTDVRCEIKGLGLEMVGWGSHTDGECFGFALRK